MNYLTKYRHEEAIVWLKNNKNAYAFAGNRFQETSHALAFVEKLFSAGAENVYIAGIRDEAWRMQQEGGPYADILIILLPENNEQRRLLFSLASLEAKQEGFGKIKDKGQSQLFLWWD